jgi:carbohydrate-binding DOMON domain-containing protein
MTSWHAAAETEWNRSNTDVMSTDTVVDGSLQLQPRPSLGDEKMIVEDGPILISFCQVGIATVTHSILGVIQTRSKSA